MQQLPQQLPWAAMHLQPARCFAAQAAAVRVVGKAATKGRSSSSSISAAAATPDIVAQQNRQRAERHKAASLAMQMAHEFRAVTIGRVVEPYKRRVPLSKELARAGEEAAGRGFIAGLLSRVYVVGRRVREPLIRWYALRKLEQVVATIDRNALPDEAAKLYLAICSANAKMEPDLIRDMVSKDVFHKLKALADRRRSQGWARIEWVLEDGASDYMRLRDTVELVQVRMLQVAESSPFLWFQLTFRISSRQRFAAYRKDGSLAHGDPSQVHDTHEFWVLERKVHEHKPEDSGRWRLVGDLDVE